MRTFIIAAIIGLIAGLIWSVLVGPWGWGVDTAGAKTVDVCASVKSEIIVMGYDDNPDGGAFVLHAVGCKDDGTRAGGMCSRYAYRLAKAWMRSTPNNHITPYLESLIQRVEQQYSRGHKCEQYETGSYGFPDKQIDCMTDPRC